MGFSTRDTSWHPKEGASWFSKSQWRSQGHVGKQLMSVQMSKLPSLTSICSPLAHETSTGAVSYSQAPRGRFAYLAFPCGKLNPTSTICQKMNLVAWTGAEQRYSLPLLWQLFTPSDVSSPSAPSHRLLKHPLRNHLLVCKVSKELLES